MSKYIENLAQFGALGSVFNAATLKQFGVLDSVINSAALKQFGALDSVVNAATMRQFGALDSVVNSAALKQFGALDSVVNAATVKQFDALDSVVNSATLKQFGVFDSVINSAALKQFSVLDLIANAVTLKQLNAFDSIVNASSLMHFDTLNSLYTEQELSEFSEVLSEVGDSFQNGDSPQQDIENTFKKLPFFFLLFLKYLFNYIVMPLFVAVCLQPLLAEYLQNSSEPRRVQKSAIKKLPQNAGIETTAVHRFISGDGVRLRSSSSIKSEVISNLSFGQLVYVLEKERSWVKVAVPQKDGNTLEGWVFNEYTERFK
ncbi:TPA: SH3 domain-containing protein [Vibrio parahaemolyticus]|nr:SH3 domain-containing protein [Vibrio parahaemolyticus]EHU4890261.1 SH3 domain-containing protein [Vibrio parahaemolyticus]EHU5134583.1 SH3 domain-containing protein [Vibrio parahaemolyticus]HAS6451910.1 SH3 domain-containing protein [Vibrio parahaemolyticus]HAS6916302.1 SH3 domain-containing protein [Vibrio parahaemolyticus]